MSLWNKILQHFELMPLLGNTNNYLLIAANRHILVEGDFFEDELVSDVAHWLSSSWDGQHSLETIE